MILFVPHLAKQGGRHRYWDFRFGRRLMTHSTSAGVSARGGGATGLSSTTG